MKLNRRACVAALAAAGLLTALPGAVAATVSAKDGLALLNDFLKSTPEGSGRFTQTVTTKDGQKAAPASAGTFAFSRPGRFYWAYEKPYRQTIVSDGKQLTLYDEDLEQATISPLSEKIPASPASLLFAQGALAEKDWKVVAQGARSVTLKPVDAGTFDEVTIRFDDSGLPAAMRLTDAFGQVTALTFSDVKAGKVDPKRFDFTPPEGSDVIDLSAP